MPIFGNAVSRLWWAESTLALLNIIHAPVWVVTLVEEPMQCCTTPALTAVQDTLHGQPYEMEWNLSSLSVLQLSILFLWFKLFTRKQSAVWCQLMLSCQHQLNVAKCTHFSSSTCVIFPHLPLSPSTVFSSSWRRRRNLGTCLCL